MYNNRKIHNNKILHNFLETVSGIADQDYQERIWVLGEGPECDDYTESICHFFDDGNPIILSYKYYGITKKQLTVLINLKKSIEEFDFNTRFKLGLNFLHSNEWAQIAILAKKVLRAFNYKKE